MIVVNYTVADGKSNWLEGMILMCLYIMLAVIFWFYPGKRRPVHNLRLPVDTFHRCQYRISNMLTAMSSIFSHDILLPRLVYARDTRGFVYTQGQMYLPLLLLHARYYVFILIDMTLLNSSVIPHPRNYLVRSV